MTAVRIHLAWFFGLSSLHALLFEISARLPDPLGGAVAFVSLLPWLPPATPGLGPDLRFLGRSQKPLNRRSLWRPQVPAGERRPTEGATPNSCSILRRRQWRGWPESCWYSSFTVQYHKQGEIR